MPSESRRAARASRDAANAREDDSAPRPRSRGRRIVRWVLAGIGLLLLMALGWLGIRIWTVATELQSAQALASDVTSGDGDVSMADRLDELGAHAQKAAAAADDPVWRAAEVIPFAGPNLQAVRLASESLDLLSNDIGVPALASFAQGGDAPLSGVLTVLQAQAPRLAELSDQVAEVSKSGMLVGQVREGIDLVDGVLQLSEPFANALPAILGADGARNYLLVFQNNAEVLGLGGSAASQTLIAVDNGALSIANQASSGDFTEGVPVDVEVDKSAIALFSNYLVDHVNTTVSRPDFPTAATLLRAFWQRDISDDAIDGVISIDPLALARILKATGPITIGGVEVTSDNAVQVLLSDVYTWWDASTDSGGKATDAFFALVARDVFEKVSTGDFDLAEMYAALTDSIANGSVMAWFDDAEDSALIDGRRVSGVLPTSNDEASTVGVFFRDSSASKIDYYLKSSVVATQTCTGDTNTFTTETTLNLDLTQAEADALPAYVQSRTWGSEQFRTQVFVYGPPGTTVDSVSVDGRDLRPLSSSAFDLDRPVAVFETYLHPGESATVTATFSGEGDFGPVDVRTTPMVQPTDITATDDCG